MTRCAEPGCGGTILPDGYCDTCGTRAAAPPPATAASPPSAPPAAAPSAPPPPAPTSRAGQRCAEPGCGGTILPDGYCDTCGALAAAPPPATAAPAAGPVAAMTASARTSPFTSGSAASGGRRRERRDTTRSTRRSGIGAGLVAVAPAAEVDPASVVMATPEVAEHKRFCSSCGEPVGRARGKRPGRTSGFCASCRTPFDFVPKLAAGELVGGQYEVAGCLAHGGLGWIYLARDTAVSGRWVVLKGLLNAGDEAAMAAAVAERRFLAEVQHPNIVEIYNFVTHDGAGYTVMEYVGGRSLKQLLKQRAEDAGGVTTPLPVEEALAYILAALPAFEYLHDRRLLYCDFKPDNLIQVGDGVKLIDLGGVRRIDDLASDIYGTVGFQAPEVPTDGPTIASDVYTIGRTLCVLTMDFRGYTSEYATSLPEPADHPALRDHDAFWRLVRKACAPSPDDRFQSVGELADQMLGVLRIETALATGTPRPGPSALFAGAPTELDDLPALVARPTDDAAAFLTHLPDDPRTALTDIDDAVAGGQVPDTAEVRLRRASLLAEAGEDGAAQALVGEILAADPWEWRATWVTGATALAAARLDDAARAFDRCRSEAPGELAPLYALARVAELASEHDRAARLYGIVSAVDRAWTAAAFGLARTRAASRQVAEAVAALETVPPTHRAHARAQSEAVRLLAAAGMTDEAIRRAGGLDVEGPARDRLEVDLLRPLVDRLGDSDGTGITVGGAPIDPDDLRRRLEGAYRRLARATGDAAERHELVDAANAVRPVTLF